MKKNIVCFLPLLLVFTFASPLLSQSFDNSVKEGTLAIAQNMKNQKDTTDLFNAQPADIMPEIITQVKPIYPPQALKDKIEGRVWLKVKVGVNGSPSTVEVVKSSNSIFDEAAVTAAKQYKFTPARQDDKPVAVWVIIPFKFDLSPDKRKENVEKECYYQDADKMPDILGGLNTLMKKLVYPELAKKNKVEGMVEIKVFVDENGEVTATQILKEIGAGCGAEAEKAIRKSKFTPAKLEGKNVKAQVIIPIMFKTK